MGAHRHLPDLLPRLTAFARTLINDHDAANDLVQEAASRALAAHRVPIDAPAYHAWMFKIVRNAALDDLRRRRSTPIEDDPGAEVAFPAVWHSDDAWIAKITVEQGLTAQGLNRRQWDESFQLMIDKHGMANIEGDDRTIVLDYLEKTYPPRARSSGGGWQNPFLKK